MRFYSQFLDAVPHQFRPWEALGDLGGIRDSHKMWGTVQELDIEPHF